jgi:sugar/nucleoside kinase (ribokinase family)
MTSSPELVVLGNLLVDDLVFEDGRTRLAEPGGAVLYAALGAALWGVRTGIVSLLGDDYPRWALEALDEHGVDLGGVHALGRPGVRAWLLYEGSRRQIVHRLERPTHAEVSPGGEHLPPAWSGARAFHLTPMPLASQRALVGALRARGAAHVSLDPHVPLRADTLPAWRELLPQLDALFVGEDELRLDHGGEGDDAVRDLLRALCAGRLALVACKRGARGGLLYDARDERCLAWPPLAAGVVDPTGAGDAFAGGFLAGRLLGDTLERALLRGAVTAAFAVADWGPRGLLAASRDAAEARLGALEGS